MGGAWPVGPFCPSQPTALGSAGGRPPEKRAAGVREAESWAGPEGWTWAGCSSGVRSEVTFVEQPRGADVAGLAGPSRRGEPSDPQGCRGTAEPNQLGTKPAEWSRADPPSRGFAAFWPIRS